MKHRELRTTATCADLAYTFVNRLWLDYVVHEVVRNVAALPGSPPPSGQARNSTKLTPKLHADYK